MQTNLKNIYKKKKLIKKNIFVKNKKTNKTIRLLCIFQPYRPNLFFKLKNLTLKGIDFLRAENKKVFMRNTCICRTCILS